MAYTRKHWLWILVNIGTALPLVLLIVAWLTNNLGFDPIDEVTDRTGSTALIVLGLSLAVTPLVTITGWRRLGTVRKSLGLWAFGYAALHLLTFIGLDYGFALDAILGDALLQKRYVLVGFAAFLILLVLAITSNRRSMRGLGKNWKRLHRWVYLAGVLAVLHFLWLVKIDRTEPLLYAAGLTLLLVLRLNPVRKRIVALRQRLTGKDKAKAARQSAPRAAA